MTNQEMVVALDRVIARWQEARAILASFVDEDEMEPVRPGSVELQTELTDEKYRTPVTVQVTVLKPRVKRERKRQSQAPAETALSGSASSGPVVVSAAEAARQREQATGTRSEPIELELSTGEQTGYSLDDLVREIEGKLQKPVAS